MRRGNVGENMKTVSVVGKVVGEMIWDGWCG